MGDIMTFLIILHFKCTGPFYGGIACIGVLGFFIVGNIHLLCFVPLVLICSMHPNICGESFRSFCIVLLHLDVLRCNLKIELSALGFWLSAFSVITPVSSVP